MTTWGVLAIALVIAAASGGCGARELGHYETVGGESTRLDGSDPDVDAMTVAEALQRRPREPVYVVGYIYAPRDAPNRLCTRLVQGACHGPSVFIRLSHLDLRGDRDSALAYGCCTIGSWSPRPVVLHVWLQPKRRAHVIG